MSIGPAAQLSFGEVGWGFAAMAVAVALAGYFVLKGRTVTQAPGQAISQPPGASGSGPALPGTVVRSLIALWLVLGVLVLALLSLALDDAQLQSTLIGGITASAGAAVAFYFSAKSSDQARQDILTATFSGVLVPDLTGKTVQDARALMSGEPLRLQVSASAAADSDTVATQDHAAGSSLPRGTAVVVTVTPAAASAPSGAAPPAQAPGPPAPEAAGSPSDPAASGPQASADGPTPSAGGPAPGAG